MKANKLRVIQDFEKVSKDIQEQIKLVYPNGFSQHLIEFKDKEDKRSNWGPLFHRAPPLLPTPCDKWKAWERGDGKRKNAIEGHRVKEKTSMKKLVWKGTCGDGPSGMLRHSEAALADPAPSLNKGKARGGALRE